MGLNVDNMSLQEVTRWWGIVRSTMLSEIANVESHEPRKMQPADRTTVKLIKSELTGAMKATDTLEKLAARFRAINEEG